MRSQATLADAALAPTDVDYVNAHASSTGLGDAIETRALKLAFGEDKVSTLAVSGTKGATGHCLGAAGAVEAAFTVLAVDRDIVPPTISYQTPDPACDIDCVPNKARELPVQVALSNSFGFGGHNAALIMRKLVDGPEPQSA